MPKASVFAVKFILLFFFYVSYIFFYCNMQHIIYFIYCLQDIRESKWIHLNSRFCVDSTKMVATMERSLLYELIETVKQFYVPFVVITIRAFPHSILVTVFVANCATCGAGTAYSASAPEFPPARFLINYVLVNL